MPFHPDIIYHVYNQGNDQRKIFLQKRNYDFFTEKMRKYLLPYCDILCYCLMPNHFHWQIKPNSLGCQPSKSRKIPSAYDETDTGYLQNLENAIRVLLSGYTQAIHKQEDSSGALFRGTKVKEGWGDGLGVPSDIRFSANEPFYRMLPYVVICFRYIHRNPVKAGLVAHPTEWLFGSAPDYGGLRDNGLCNYQLVEEMLGIRRMNR